MVIQLGVQVLHDFYLFIFIFLSLNPVVGIFHVVYQYMWMGDYICLRIC